MLQTHFSLCLNIVETQYVGLSQRFCARYDRANTPKNNTGHWTRDIIAKTWRIVSVPRIVQPQQSRGPSEYFIGYAISAFLHLPN